MKKWIFAVFVFLASVWFSSVWFSSCGLSQNFAELNRVFTKAKLLITDCADAEKLDLAVQKILQLSKSEKPVLQNEIARIFVFEDGDSKVSVRKSHGGAFKGAFGHSVKTAFYFQSGDTHINFFLCNDDAELFVDIGGGGVKSGELQEYSYDFAPDRFYEVKAKTVRTGDFYWD